MDEKLTEEQVETAKQLIVQEFFTAMVALAGQDDSLKELSYVKTPIELPNGGIYLISILHISGPKLDLELLKAVSQSQTEQNKEGASNEGI